MFGSDYPRGVVNCLWLWCFPAFHALSVTSALLVPFFLTRRCLPISLLRLPSRPSPRRFPALCAAITLVRLRRMKVLLAPFEQTPACSRPAEQSLPPATL